MENFDILNRQKIDVYAERKTILLYYKICYQFAKSCQSTMKSICLLVFCLALSHGWQENGNQNNGVDNFGNNGFTEAAPSTNGFTERTPSASNNGFSMMMNIPGLLSSFKNNGMTQQPPINGNNNGLTQQPPINGNNNGMTQQPAINGNNNGMTQHANNNNGWSTQQPAHTNNGWASQQTPNNGPQGPVSNNGWASQQSPNDGYQAQQPQGPVQGNGWASQQSPSNNGHQAQQPQGPANSNGWTSQQQTHGPVSNNGWATQAPQMNNGFTLQNHNGFPAQQSQNNAWTQKPSMSSGNQMPSQFNSNADDMHSNLKEARDIFIKAVDDYIRKCQELAQMVSNSNKGGYSQQNSQDENKESDEELEKMMNKFTTILQGFAFQLASTGPQ